MSPTLARPLAIVGSSPRRLLAVVGMAMFVFLLGGCGGGGGSGNNSSGGGGGTPPPVNNTQAVTVDQGPVGLANLLFTSVTICAPGATTNCQTIDHIQVDTGSTGLRIISSVLSPALSLRQQTDSSGNAIAECAQFVDGFSWGPVKIADIHLAGEVASSAAVQVIGDPAFANIPDACSAVGPPENTVDTFGANGIIGVWLFLQDCGLACAQSTSAGYYYSCSSQSCQPAIVAVAQQLQNPVSMFATDNNGVIIALPSVPAAGAATATGTMIFGIGTQSNNGASNVTVLPADPNTGYITTVFNNHTYSTSYIDSGTNGLYFGNGIFPACSPPDTNFYCPAATQTLTATMRGASGMNSVNVNFSVANADLITANGDLFAFSDLAGEGPDTTTFAWGLPFFYGRTVFTAIEGKTTPVGTGPFFAF